MVGVIEDFPNTLRVLEDKIPLFFGGVIDLYFNVLHGKIWRYIPHLFCITLFIEPHRNRQQRVKSVSWEAKEKLEQSLGQEIAFYDWIRSRLDKQVTK